MNTWFGVTADKRSDDVVNLEALQEAKCPFTGFCTRKTKREDRLRKTKDDGKYGNATNGYLRKWAYCLWMKILHTARIQKTNLKNQKRKD